MAVLPARPQENIFLPWLGWSCLCGRKRIFSCLSCLAGVVPKKIFPALAGLAGVVPKRKFPALAVLPVRSQDNISCLGWSCWCGPKRIFYCIGWSCRYCPKRILSCLGCLAGADPREYFPALAVLPVQSQEKIILPWLVLPERTQENISCLGWSCQCGLKRIFSCLGLGLVGVVP